MNIWHDIDKLRIKEDSFVACIEIPKGCKNKYELDKETGLLKLDRILYTSTQYPANYGFIPKTYCDDCDPLDVLVICNETILPMTLVKCRPIGVLIMTDECENDEKIIAVVENDPYMDGVNDIEQLQKHIFDEIMHFFNVYKNLEGKNVEVKHVLGHLEAKNIINKAINKYDVYFNNI